MKIKKHIFVSKFIFVKKVPGSMFGESRVEIFDINFSKMFAIFLVINSVNLTRLKVIKGEAIHISQIQHTQIEDF
jgi:hypothetical protein